MKTKKLLSLLLALMMMLSVVPMYASAADPIALTEANVTVWPTANGEIYYGQKINEGITLSGGEVQCDGVVVPGHFEFVDPEQRNSKGYTDLKFVPDDTTSYSAFEIANAFNVIFTLNKTTPVFVDANNTPVATEVASAGTLLGKSKISGGQVMNPFYPEESTALGFTWSWVNRREPVTKSGYYEAKLGAGNYNTITTMIYVKIAGDVPETSIVETPTIPELNYNPDITWADVPLTGGKAVINDNEEVSGTFAISDTWKDKVPEIGSYNVSVIFTPDDLTKASVYTMLIPVTVNKGVMKFVDDNGNEIVPEYTIPYGYDLDNYSAPIFEECKKYLNTGDEIIRLSFSEEDSKTKFDVGTYELTVRATPYYTTSNYLRNDNLKVKITVEPGILNPTIKSSTEGYYVQDNSSTYNVKGTFDVYVNDKLIASDVKYLEDKVKWEATENGTYTMKWVYNPVENDNFIIDDVTTTMNVILPNTITYTGMSAYILGSNDKRSELFETTERKQGTPVTIGCDLPAFATWIITDANGNTVDLGIEDLTATEITFTMPAYDIVITTKTALDLAAEDCDHICHSDNPLFQMLWKVLTFIFRLFDVQQYCDCGNLHYDAPLFG